MLIPTPWLLPPPPPPPFCVQEEMLNSLLEEQPPTNKLALCLLAGGLISAGAAAVCWVCGLDPAGGASLSADSARAAAVGGAAAAPLVALKALLWSEWARQQLPFLDDIHKAQVDAFKPVMANLNAAQTTLLLATGAWGGRVVVVKGHVMAACGARST